MLKFGTVKPMLAKRSQPFSNENWIFELKWDGTRCLAFIEERVRLQNRRLLEITPRYPELQTLKEWFPKNTVLDGELVVFHKGKPNFYFLQEREHSTAERNKILAEIHPAVYIIFDILQIRGKVLLKKKLMERKAILQRFNDGDYHIILDFIEEEGKKLFRKAVKEGLEGIMGKYKDSPYLPGQRSDFWKKIKNENTVDLVICGYLPSEARKIASFLLCEYKNGWKYVCKVGTGFSQKEIEYVLKHGKPGKKLADIKNACWLQPQIVAEIRYLEKTPEGKLRAPVFVRFRSDKKPKECKLYDF